MKTILNRCLALLPFLAIAGVLLAGLLGSFPFASDEGDNMLGAVSVSRGGDIYKAYFSQHTPFAYYFTALYALMGVDSVLGFRIAFNVTLLLAGLILYAAYAGTVPGLALRFFVAAYALAAPFFLGHLILAEVFSAYALVVLLIEYLRYLESRTLPIGRMIVIALCAFVAVMSCFVSVYAVFIILLGFGIGEQQGLSWSVFPDRCRRWLTFLLLLVIPFVLFLTWYAASGNLLNFYDQAYRFNRTVYSRYTGIGQNMFVPFLTMPMAWVGHVVESTRAALAGRAVPLHLLLAVTNLVFLAGIFRRQPLAALVLFLFLAATGIRGYGGSGYTGFHSMPYDVVSLLVCGLVLAGLVRPKLWARLGILGLLILFLGAALPNYASCAFKINPLRKPRLFPTHFDPYIQKHTREADPIWMAGINAYGYIDNHRRPASRVWGIVPWVADQYSDVVIEDLQRTRPKLVIFDPEQRVWGHRAGDYGARIFNYIQACYRPADLSDEFGKVVYLLK